MSGSLLLSKLDHQPIESTLLLSGLESELLGHLVDPFTACLERLLHGLPGLLQSGPELCQPLGLLSRNHHFSLRCDILNG